MAHHPVLLLGSIPFADADEVFKNVGSTLGQKVRRIPDGETGERLEWIQWQTPFLKAISGLEEFVVPSPYKGRPDQTKFRLPQGKSAASIKLSPLGYADVAIESYGKFAARKKAGDIPSDSRFQVSIPTPLGCTFVHIDLDSAAALEPLYEEGLKAEIERIAKAVPPEELAVQWDVAVEFMMLEFEHVPAHLTDRLGDTIDRLAKIGDFVPDGAELGYHFCYGDSDHKHFKEPEDMSKLIAVANGLVAKAPRRIDWIHMPVPRDRDDDAYFAPLANLKLPEGTELYLGLVHLTGGAEGTRRRMETANRHCTNYGIGTECGFGRRDPETIKELLKLHAEVSSG